MDNTTTNPHDTRHKELFSNKKSFLSLLRDCVKEPWIDAIDEDSLTKTNNTFVLQDFSKKEADIVYEAKINGSTVIFYVLLELQSRVGNCSSGAVTNALPIIAVHSGNPTPLL